MTLHKFFKINSAFFANFINGNLKILEEIFNNQKLILSNFQVGFFDKNKRKRISFVLVNFNLSFKINSVVILQLW